jgi:hypothetical protein
VPFLVLGNKCDVKCAVSEERVRDALGIFDRTPAPTVGHSVMAWCATRLFCGRYAVADERPIDVFMCSATRRCGYAEGTERAPFLGA